MPTREKGRGQMSTRENANHLGHGGGGCVAGIAATHIITVVCSHSILYTLHGDVYETNTTPGVSAKELIASPLCSWNITYNKGPTFIMPKNPSYSIAFFKFILGNGQHQAAVGIRQRSASGSGQHQTVVSIRPRSALDSGRHQAVVSIRQWSASGSGRHQVAVSIRQRSASGSGRHQAAVSIRQRSASDSGQH